MLLGEGEKIAAFRTTAEAAPALRIRVHNEGGRPLAVEGTVGLVVAAGLLQRHVLLNVTYDVDAGLDFVSYGHVGCPRNRVFSIRRAVIDGKPVPGRIQGCEYSTLVLNCPAGGLEFR